MTVRELCPECGFEILACTEITLLRMALERLAVLPFQRPIPGLEPLDAGWRCSLCEAEQPSRTRDGQWHHHDCRLRERGCSEGQLSIAHADRRDYGAGFLVIDPTLPGGLRRLDPASISIRLPTTVKDAKL